MTTNKTQPSPATPSLFSRRLFWIVVNAGQIYLVYAWLFQSQEWAGNVLKFMVGYIAFASLGYLTKSGKEHCSKEGRSMPAWATQFIDVSIALALASQAHFIMAGIVVFSLVAECAAYDLPHPGENDPKAP